MKNIFASILVAATIVGCAHSASRTRSSSDQPLDGSTVHEPKPVGAWAEPMPDVVKVPGGLDPTGTYYLPEHNEVVEIRPDRYERVDYDAKSKKR